MVGKETGRVVGVVVHLVVALGVIISMMCLIVTTKAPRQSYVYAVFLSYI